VKELLIGKRPPCSIVHSRILLLVRLFGNEPFGSGPEPGTWLIATNLLLPPGEVPEGRARKLSQP
jgi:hypothetical protein